MKDKVQNNEWVYELIHINPSLRFIWNLITTIKHAFFVCDYLRLLEQDFDFNPHFVFSRMYKCLKWSIDLLTSINIYKYLKWSIDLLNSINIFSCYVKRWNIWISFLIYVYINMTFRVLPFPWLVLALNFWTVLSWPDFIDKGY